MGDSVQDRVGATWELEKGENMMGDSVQDSRRGLLHRLHVN